MAANNGSVRAVGHIEFDHEAAVGTDSRTAAERVMEKAAPVLLKQK